MANKDDLPPFLHGCFDWRVNGLQWQAPEGVDLLSPGALVDDNPWIVLAAVVERAKKGDHREAPRALSLARHKTPFALDRVSLLVFAEIATGKDLPLLEEFLSSDNRDWRRHAAEAAALANDPTLIPAVLSAWWESSNCRHRRGLNRRPSSSTGNNWRPSPRSRRPCPV